jgi:hypothetical protein
MQNPESSNQNAELRIRRGHPQISQITQIVVQDATLGEVQPQMNADGHGLNPKSKTAIPLTEPNSRTALHSDKEGVKVLGEDLGREAGACLSQV